jgi:hypothetical protein
MWLFAGTTSYCSPTVPVVCAPFFMLLCLLLQGVLGERWFSFKYSNQKGHSNNVKTRSQSAGNLNNKAQTEATLKQSIKEKSDQNSVTLSSYSADIVESTSETLRCNSGENIKKISVHVPIHSRPQSDEEFGQYLAGLIDGDGHFSNALQLVIVFNILDSSLAYFIKSKLGYGKVYKVKNKNAVILVIASKAGICKVLDLINGKIRSNNKLDQINNNILSNPKFNSLKKSISLFSKNNNNNLNNYWLAGFADADASFQIKIVNREKRIEVRLNFQIDQKKNDLLILIKSFLGGNIGYRESQDTYYYGSTSFGSAKNVINYFDKYHLMSSKHINYLKWRKAYIIIMNKEHLTSLGLNKIIRLKTTMNRFNTDTP